MHLNRPPLPHRIDPFMRLALHIHPIHRNPKHPRNTRADRIPIPPNLGPLTHHRRIQVHHPKPTLPHPLHRLGYKHRRIRRFMPRVCIRKQLPNIPLPNRPQKRISHRMQQRISIRMPHRPAIRIYPHTAKNEPPPLPTRSQSIQPMQVIPMPNPNTITNSHQKPPNAPQYPSYFSTATTLSYR